MQHTGEWPPEALKLHVYPGEGESWLYGDDGHSLAYREGAYQVTRFLSEMAGGGLNVRREVEGDYHPGYDRFDIQIHGLDAAPRALRIDGEAIEATFDPGTGTARLAVGDWSHLEMR